MACKDIDGYSSEKPCPDESHQDSLLETNIILTKILPFLPVDKKRLMIMSTLGIHSVECPLICILDQHSLDTWLTLRPKLSWLSIDNPSKSWLTIHKFPIKAYELVDTPLTIDLLKIKCWMSVYRVSIRMSIKYWSRCQSRVSIDTRLWMSLAHMIQLFYNLLIHVYWYLLIALTRN